MQHLTEKIHAEHEPGHDYEHEHEGGPNTTPIRLSDRNK